MRQDAKALIDSMSEAQLRVVSEFLAFIRDHEASAATQELLDAPGFKASYARGRRDIKTGCTKTWRKVRTDV